MSEELRGRGLEPSGLDLGQVSWPMAELGRALALVRARLGYVDACPKLAEPGASDRDAPQRWLSRAARELELELEAVTSRADELDSTLRRLGSALILLPRDASDDRVAEPRFLVLLRGGRRCKLLTRDGLPQRVSVDAISAVLLAPLLDVHEGPLATLWSNLGVRVEPEARRRLALILLDDDVPVGGLWIVRPPPNAPALILARALHLPALLALLLAARVLSTAAFVALFWSIGRDALGYGEVSLTALVLCALTMISLRLVDAWAQSQLTLRTSALVKEALLHGILRVDRAAIVGRGAGQFLSMAMAGELSSSAARGALNLLLAVIELGTAAVVLGQGLAGLGLVWLLLAWTGATAWLCSRYVAATETWAAHDRAVTRDLIERMVGYQTRLVQEQPERRHRDEDSLLRDYLLSTQTLDRHRLPLAGFAATGWLVVALALLEPALRTHGDPGAMAISLGGMLIAANALRVGVASVFHLGEVWVGWRVSASLFAAGRTAARVDPDPPRPPASSKSPASRATLLRFEGLELRYRERGPLVLRGCSQAIGPGERVLLEGPSGGGKSTLAQVLAGLRLPDAGTVRVRGVDGRNFDLRERVVLVPQFHDNHVLTASLLFNILLGRGYPPQVEDLREAWRVCELLGLGPLLAKMPLGPSQPIGDGGWVLSHGERSRVFLARALLQERVELLILDESLAALDPGTLLEVGEALLDSAPALLVIAHT